MTITSLPEQEIWRTVVGHHGYEVSDRGRVRRKVNGRIRQPSMHDQGYLRLTLTGGGVRTNCFVHRLVACAFHGAPPSSKHECAHNNGVRTDNRAENLRWATSTENNRDKFLHGTDSCGDRNGRCVITESKVASVVSDRLSGLSQRALSRKHGVSQPQISRILRGLTGSSRNVLVLGCAK